MDRVGAYSWHPSTDRWVWNDAMFHLLGYASGEVRPSRALVLAHKHPDDRERVAATMADAVGRRSGYACHHRIVAAGGAVHEVVALGYPAPPDDRWPAGLLLRGWIVHLATPVPGRPTDRAARDRAMGEISTGLATGSPTLPMPVTAPPGGPDPAPWARSRAEHDRHVERAVQVLAETCRLTGDAAGGLLAHLANAHAMPLIVVAERVVAASLDPERPGLAGLMEGIDPEVR